MNLCMKLNFCFLFLLAGSVAGNVFAVGVMAILNQFSEKPLMFANGVRNKVAFCVPDLLSVAPSE